MESSLPKSLLVLSFFLFLFVHLLPLCSAKKSLLTTYHKGPLLTGDVNLSVLWYGQINPIQKSAIKTFIQSLNNDHNVSFEPRVSSWWNIVESYQTVANKSLKKSPKITVKAVKEIDDDKYSIGKVLNDDSLAGLVQKASGRTPNTVAVIFAANDVTVKDSCSEWCFLHGAIGKQVYIVVGNPENECPSTCAWPFHRSENGALGLTLDPPSGDEGTDSMIVHFASALAATITNPYETGFFGGLSDKPLEATTACKGVFGTGAFPGYTGKVRVDPRSGGGFNAHGLNNARFLLPAVWNPKNSSCWTLM
ncbi:unnamed protein product [Ilex paraguariensis]|uniref:Uncharacterized protein n=1 Tax=Ilex paraguariensis TaxID=185542 RepID=A0ABC8R085_9AQUA